MLQGDPLVLERWKWLRARFPSTDGLVEARVLDAGCGNGCFALWAAEMGCEVLGLSDTGDDLRKAADRGTVLELPNAHFEAFDLRELPEHGHRLGQFDVILCLEVVEHVIDDVALLRSLADRLPPGGTLLLTSPTDDHRPLFGERAHQSVVEDGRHVRWGYSEAQLAEVLRDAGFEPSEFARFGGYLTQRVCGALWRLSRFDLRFAWVTTFPLRVVTLIDHKLTTRLRLPFMTIGVVARKPLADTLGA